MLIADDEQLSRTVLGQLLTRAGYQAVVVGRGDELDRALSQVKQLEGLITICMHCKRIATGAYGWQRLEACLAANSHASSTHGLCEQCLEHHFRAGPDDKGP